MLKRCTWCGCDPLYVAYHDEEWGVPLHDDRRLFEMLVLEGSQAGLNWLTILRKRENYRKAFAGFAPEQVAGYGEAEIARLLQNAGIVRNRLKIEAAIVNAGSFLRLRDEHGSFSTYLWEFVNGAPLVNSWRTHAEIPVQTRASERLSKSLKQRGFRFVGPTICYAFMQAVGMVNDHTTDCFRYGQLKT